MEFAIGADQQLFRGATLSVNYLNTRGVHQFLSQNINAPTGKDADGNFIYPIPPADGRRLRSSSSISPKESTGRTS